MVSALDVRHPPPDDPQQLRCRALTANVPTTNLNPIEWVGWAKRGCASCRTRPVDDRWRPFCSERCRTEDLARWADGRYRVAGEPVPAPDNDPDPDS